MAIWKHVAAWATKMEEEASKRRKPTPHRNLSRIEFHNTLHAFEGGIAEMFKTAGGLLVQHISTCTNDLAKVIRDGLDEYIGQMQEWIDQSYRLYDNSIKGYFDALNGAAEIRHNEADERAGKRQNAIMNILVQMYKKLSTSDNSGFHAIANQISLMDLNASERYLETVERIRVMDMRNEEAHRITFGTMIALFENLTEQIAKKQRVVVEYKSEPTVEWLIDHHDELIGLAEALKALRDNSAPQNTATMLAVRSVRTMIPDVSIAVVADLLGAKAEQWQSAA